MPRHATRNVKTDLPSILAHDLADQVTEFFLAYDGYPELQPAGSAVRLLYEYHLLERQGAFEPPSADTETGDPDDR